MSFDLASMSRRARNIRRPAVVIRDIVPPAVLATDLFRGVYLPVVNGWAARVERIIAEYERTLAESVQDGYTVDQANSVPEPGLRVSCCKIAGARQQDVTPAAVGPNPTVVRLTDSPADVHAVLEEVAEALTRLVLTLTPRLRAWALNVEKWQRSKWRSAILSATGVDLQTVIGPELARTTIETAIEWNVALVKDVNAQARQRIANAVFTGLREVGSARDVAKEIREAVAMSRRRAIGIASDQLSKLTSALAAERRREAGLDTYKYRHSGKLHPRPWHKARDGNLYSEDPERVGDVVEGQTVNPEIPADDRAGVPPFCGCREQAVVIFE